MLAIMNCSTGVRRRNERNAPDSPDIIGALPRATRLLTGSRRSFASRRRKSSSISRSHRSGMASSVLSIRRSGSPRRLLPL
jgi:hypothetical protein